MSFLKNTNLHQHLKNTKEITVNLTLSILERAQNVVSQSTMNIWCQTTKAMCKPIIDNIDKKNFLRNPIHICILHDLDAFYNILNQAYQHKTI
jgi:hypothetical protein